MLQFISFSFFQPRDLSHRREQGMSVYDLMTRYGSGGGNCARLDTIVRIVTWRSRSFLRCTRSLLTPPLIRFPLLSSASSRSWPELPSACRRPPRRRGVRAGHGSDLKLSGNRSGGSRRGCRADVTMSIVGPNYVQRLNGFGRQT